MRLFCWLALAAVLPAQVSKLVIEPSAGGHAMRIDAVDVPALELVAKAAAITSCPLRIEKEVLETLAGRTVLIRREHLQIDELGLLLGLRLGLDVSFVDGVLAFAPAAPRARAQRQALTQVEHALLGHACPPLMPALRYQRACLLFVEGHEDVAATAFSDLIDDFPQHVLSVDARGLAICAALRARRNDLALKMLAVAEESAEGLPAAPAADLLPARVHAALGNLKEALLRARHVATSADVERDRALGALLLAELSWRAKDGKAVLAALDMLPDGFDRTCRDLVSKESLARGLGMRLLGDTRAALLHLRVALRSVPQAGKAVVARAIADCFAAADSPVPAYLAMREAVVFETRPEAKRNLLVRCAEMEADLMFTGKAIETCAAILEEASGPFPEAERLLATLSRSLVVADRIDEARVALGALAEAGAWKSWASFALAKLERRAGDFERALRVLQRIQDADCQPPGPRVEEVRALRGQLLLDIGDPVQAADVFRGAVQEGPK